MDFKTFKLAVATQFSEIAKTGLFTTTVPKDDLWNMYLLSFPEGTNPIYRERTEHDCQCCKQFVRAVGNVVTIVEGKLISIWDIDELSDTDPAYKVVARHMAELVKLYPIENTLLLTERTAGTDKNLQLVTIDNVDTTITWNHFFVNIPTQYVSIGSTVGGALSERRASYDVFARSLLTLHIEAIDVVLELIAQNSIYRGEEHKNTLIEFRKHKVATQHLSEKQLSLYVWQNVLNTREAVARIRNTSIGTLLTALSEGTEIEVAVSAFERMVAPANYKRPTALVTPAMVNKAKATIAELGLSSALERRYATIRDIEITNILYVAHNTRSKLLKSKTDKAFDTIATTTAKNFSKVQEIHIDDFITDVLPTITKLEVLLENRLEPNLVSLIAPVDPTATSLFKWSNEFSWSYKGDLTDSIKERVKAAGGVIEADLCCRLAWFNYDDLDLHMIEPNGTHISFSQPFSNTGRLDVDMNAGNGKTRTPVENIFYANKKKMATGVYTLFVNQYSAREKTDVGFVVEIVANGITQTFEYPQAVTNMENIEVAKIEFIENGFVVQSSLSSTQRTKEIWNLQTNTFHAVDVLMLSPNFWDGQIGIGNKHYFFMLSNCKNEQSARGFYNEFLRTDLDQHRKVLEIVGSKIKTENSDQQLSGIGFSSTQRNTLTVRVEGAMTRTLKLTF